MEFLQLPILWAMLSAYVGAFMLFVYELFIGNEKIKKAALAVTALGCGLNLVAIVIRALLIKGIPLNNGMEFGMCFAFALAVIYLFAAKKWNLTSVGAFVLVVVIGLGAWIINLDMTVNPLNPSLRSYWLSFHVSTAVISYGAFAMSFALSVAYLLKERGKLKSLPDKEILDEVSYKMIFVGMPFLTIMLVTGSVWAEYAWGRFWSWDPKETFALVTWLVYALYLHIRLMRGWKGRRTAILSIVGFAAILFTFFGVSYLLPGLHSYIQ